MNPTKGNRIHGEKMGEIYKHSNDHAARPANDMSEIHGSSTVAEDHQTSSVLEPSS